MQNTIVLNSTKELSKISTAIFDAKTIKNAYDFGYRSFIIDDFNNTSVFVKDSGVNREDITIITHIEMTANHIMELKSAIANNCFDYIDILVVNHPPESTNHNFKDKFTQLWKILADFKNQKYIYDLGLANFTDIKMIEYILECVKKFGRTEFPKPVVNQVQINPLSFPQQLVKFCHEKGIQIATCGLFGGSSHIAHIIKSPAIIDVSNDILQTIERDQTNTNEFAVPKDSNNTVQQDDSTFFTYDALTEDQKMQFNAEVIIQWALQHGFLLWLNAQNLQHLKTNLKDVQSPFTLNPEEMKKLDEMHKRHDRT